MEYYSKAYYNQDDPDRPGRKDKDIEKKSGASKGGQRNPGQGYQGDSSKQHDHLVYPGQNRDTQTNPAGYSDTSNLEDEDHKLDDSDHKKERNLEDKSIHEKKSSL